MADKKISGLTPAGTLTGFEQMELNQGGLSVRSDLSALASLSSDNMSEITVDITGLTTIVLSGIESIINLTSSNATETIDNITISVVNLRVSFRPAPGLDVTFNDTSVNAGNIHLSAPSLVCYGSKSGYLKVETRASEFYQNEFLDQYV